MDEGLKQLAEVLGWKNYESYFHNSSRDYRSPVSPDMEEEIARLNQLDMKLYADQSYTFGGEGLSLQRR